MTKKQPKWSGVEDNPPPDRENAAGAESPPPVDSGAAADDVAGDVVEQLRCDLEQVTDRALRAQAELENYRRRVARQAEEDRRYANLPLLRDLLPVLDNMHRAIEAAEKTEDANSLLEGFRMVTRQLEDVLRQYHCLPIEAALPPFDPNVHEAIYQQPTADHPAGTVLQVAQTGFQLHDRVVRPSQVVVSGDVPGQEAGPAAPGDDGGGDSQG